MRRLVVLVAVAGLVFVGCGGDDEERLSSAEFKTQANEICTEGSKELEEAAKKFGDEQPTDEELEQFLEEDFKPNINQQLDDLEELAPPEDVEEEFDEVIADARKILNGLDADDMTSEDDPFDEVNGRLNELGLNSCGTGG
jgi:hypothetical protein